MSQFKHLDQRIGSVNIDDNLTSESTSSALSANQGRELNEKINGTVGGDAYSSTHTSKSGIINKYDYGETCIYKNMIYWCKATSGVSASTLPTDTAYWEETSLASLKLSLTNNIVVESKTIESNITIAGNAKYYKAYDISKSGYTIISIVPHINVWVDAISVSCSTNGSNMAYLLLNNFSSGQATGVNLSCTVVYKKV